MPNGAQPTDEPEIEGACSGNPEDNVEEVVVVKVNNPNTNLEVTSNQVKSTPVTYSSSKPVVREERDTLDTKEGKEAYIAPKIQDKIDIETENPDVKKQRELNKEKQNKDKQVLKKEGNAGFCSKCIIF